VIVSAAPRWSLVLTLLVPTFAAAQTPTLTDDRLVIELVAKDPDLVTPTGLAVDERGRAWVIENHTHHRPASYKGPESDRIRIFADFDEKGLARKITTFADGFKDAMGLHLARDGNIYLATRSTIYRMRDKDGSAADKQVLVRLETTCTYPHNGLSGFAVDALGTLYFGMGENLGASYKLIAADGTTLTGGGEGGNIFRVRPDGTRLRRVATGFWNPFHLTFDAFGRLFAVDNDPDARGPCRLLHVVPGGDYGYRFRFGRKGLHPFLAWNGDLPGILPMVAGTAEAPSGVIAYESTGLPPEYRGNLLATSWGDHVIERFQLTPVGASFGAKAQTLARGGENFRPVGIVAAPDGSLFVTDWVDKSYPVHGKGRLWRIRMKNPQADDGMRPSKVAGLEVARLKELLAHPSMDIRGAAAEALATQGKEAIAEVLRGKAAPRARVAALWAAARMKPEAASELLLLALMDADADVRGAAVDLLGSLLPDAIDKRNEAALLERALKDPSPFVRMQAVLQLRSPTSLKAILPLLADRDPFLLSAALDVLGRPGQSALLLAQVEAPDVRLRLGVLLALRRSDEPAGRDALPKFLDDADPDVRRAAIQWVGEEKLRKYADQLAASAARAPVTRELFLALLAASNLLSKDKLAEEPADEKFLAAVIQGKDQPAAFRNLALQMLRPDHPALTVARLREFIDGQDATIRVQAARTLAMRSDKASQEELRRLAADERAEVIVRAEAVRGLALSAADNVETQRLLLGLLALADLQRDALRSLRAAALHAEVEPKLMAWWEASMPKNDGPPTAERREMAAQLALALKASKTPEVVKRLPDLIRFAGERPRTEADWRAALAKGGDAAAGGRVFFHSQGPKCYSCHRVDGRGAAIGPDLSQIARSHDRGKLLESILTPSKEIAPMFVAWSIATTDGKVRTGLIVEEGANSTITIADAQGKLEVIKRQDIEERHALPTSIMPDSLHETMTHREFLDLLAFLSARK